MKRIVKAKLSAVDAAAGGDGTRDFQVNKDALLAFCEAGKVRRRGVLAPLLASCTLLSHSS